MIMTNLKTIFRMPLIIYLEGYKREASEIKRLIKSIYNCDSKIISRKRRKQILCNRRICKRYSLIITIGGDGTFLRTAHFVKETIILGLNPKPLEKEGFLTTTSTEEFKQLLKMKNQNFSVVRLPRIKVRINNKELEEKAVNEVFIGSKKSYKTIRYELIVGNKSEEQLSSGIIVATAQGTKAWFRSAGGLPVKNTTENNKKLYFVIREPYFGRVHSPKLLMGSGKRIVIKPKQNSILVFDSLSEEHSLKKDDFVVLDILENDLRVLNF